MHIGDHRQGRACAIDPLQRQRQMRMGRMRFAAQRVDDPTLKPLKLLPRRLGNGHHIGDIGQAPNPKPQSLHRAMIDHHRRETDRPRWPRHLKGAMCDSVQIKDGRVGRVFGLHERIGKPRQQRLLRRMIGPDRQPLPHVEDNLAQIVNAMGVIGMRMGEHHAIQRANPGIQKLLAHVGRGVDQHPGDRIARQPLHQHRAATAAVLAVQRITITPIAPQPRHAARRAAAQNGKPHRRHYVACALRVARGNRRSKLAVVAAANSASVTPNTLAPTRAVKAV